eukprot:CAMPEP_0171624026 /NCGR_PEP_ID=MMETSP0990-20121206/18337_1 /TAXON_ID=483369 /ORGANISM="non described non described, Strain CCMP2098" /LENGTH=769 /DNA_ID=CAMNT_0012190423 /DNA_START=28 /DNA_END=2337 /DNA_ORIENTATION=+
MVELALSPSGGGGSFKPLAVAGLTTPVAITLPATVPFTLVDSSSSSSSSSEFDGDSVLLQCPFENVTHACDSSTNGGGGNGKYVFEYTCALVVPKCVWFDNSSNAFKGDGCSVQAGYTSNEVTCECSHLTAFALTGETTPGVLKVVATQTPTTSPSGNPTSSPTSNPTPNPTQEPSPTPTTLPTSAPTSMPSPKPTLTPSLQPSPLPTLAPSFVPTANPTPPPSHPRTLEPSKQPTLPPSLNPTDLPTFPPTFVPTTLAQSESVGEFITVSFGLAASTAFLQNGLFQYKKQLAKAIFEYPAGPFDNYDVVQNLLVTSVQIEPTAGNRRALAGEGGEGDGRKVATATTDVENTQSGYGKEEEAASSKTAVALLEANFGYWSSTKFAQVTAERVSQLLLERLTVSKGFYGVDYNQTLVVTAVPRTLAPTPQPTLTVVPANPQPVPAPTTRDGIDFDGSQESSAASASGLLIALIVMGGCLGLVCFGLGMRKHHHKDTNDTTAGAKLTANYIVETDTASAEHAKDVGSGAASLSAAAAAGGGGGELTGTMAMIAQQHPGHVSELAALKTELRSFLESEGLPLGVFEALHAFGVDSIQDLEHQLEILSESGIVVHKDLDLVGDVGLTPTQVEHLKASLQKRFTSSEDEEDGGAAALSAAAAAAAADDYDSDGDYDVENPDYVSSGATQLGDAAIQAVLDMPSSEVELVNFVAPSPADALPNPPSRHGHFIGHFSQHPARRNVAADPLFSAASVYGAPPPATSTEMIRAFEAEI